MTTYLPLERIIRRGVLGLRFIDAATGAHVTDGLNVLAWQIGTSYPLFAATRAPSSGVYGYRSLPGLEKYVRGERELTDYCADANAPPTYFLVIEDGARRFLPQLQRLCLPKAALFEVPLFSNPARNLGAALGTLRGQVMLKQPGDPTPAAWAVVTAQFNSGPIYETVSDERGLFALFVPYPKPATPPNQWAVTVRVRSNVPSLTPPTGIPLAAFAKLPDMKTIVGQPANQLFNTLSDATPVDSITRTLVAGSDLIVESHGGEKRLFIKPSA
jgi:hypothetical protein